MRNKSLHQVFIQFAYGQQDRMSEPYGPFEYIEGTYNAIYVNERSREIAYLTEQGMWRTEDGQEWSDWTIVSE